MSAQMLYNTEENHNASFSLTLRADSTFRKSEDSFILEVSITALRGEHPIGQRLTSRIVVPADEFKDEDDARAWADLTFRSFRARSTDALVHEAVLSFRDESTETLNERSEGNQIDLEAMLTRHVRDTGKRIRERFNVKKTGPAAGWSNTELEREVAEILRELPEQQRTYTVAAEKLKQRYGSRAPDSGEALRKMLKRLQIDWAGLKAGRVSTVEEPTPS